MPIEPEMPALSQVVSDSRLPTEHGLAELLPCLGRSSFEVELAKLLSDTLGAEQIHIFHGAVEGPSMIASISTDGSMSADQQSRFYLDHRIWRFDSEFARRCQSVSGGPAVLRLDTQRPDSPELRSYYEIMDMGERVVAVGNGPEGRLYLAAIWSRLHGVFTTEQEHKLRVMGDLAFPMLAQHYALLRERRDLPRALTSLAVIERCLSLSSQAFPKREAEVAARILYGLSAEGIALDLGIGIETVVCYRRRFYQRFGISCFRELVVWYMTLFGQVSHNLVEH